MLDTMIQAVVDAKMSPRLLDPGVREVRSVDPRPAFGSTPDSRAVYNIWD